MHKKIICIYDVINNTVTYEIPEDSMEVTTFEALGILEGVKAEIIKHWQEGDD